MKPTIVPFVKWAGGKRQHLAILQAAMPPQFGTYHEPFLGGGALALQLQPSSAILSDANKELINAYQVIKNSYKRLREYLLLMEAGHSELFYKKIKHIDRNDPHDLKHLSMRDSKVLRAARFIYLNKASFNGLYRVNKQGYFNVPWNHQKHIKIFDYPNIAKLAHYLKTNNVKIKHADFRQSATWVQKNDFVYFDPPYDFEQNRPSFTAYQKESFAKEGQLQLYVLCKALDDLGVFWMLSNHNTKFIQRLYRDFHIQVVSSKRRIGGKGASRQNVEEVIVTNYVTQK